MPSLHQFFKIYFTQYRAVACARVPTTAVSSRSGTQYRLIHAPPVPIHKDFNAFFCTCHTTHLTYETSETGDVASSGARVGCTQCHEFGKGGYGDFFPTTTRSEAHAMLLYTSWGCPESLRSLPYSTEDPRYDLRRPERISRSARGTPTTLRTGIWEQMMAQIDILAQVML